MRVSSLLSLIVIAIVQMPLLAQPAVPGDHEFRSTIERNTIVIETYNFKAKQRTSIGTGFIIGATDGQLLFGTAAHVLKKYRQSVELDQPVELRGWAESSEDYFRLKPHELNQTVDDRTDFAVLRTNEENARRYINPDLDALIVAPIPSRDSETLYSYGWDQDAERLSWARKGWVRRATESTIEFDASGIMGGRSGSLLCTGFGPIGVIRARGTRGRLNQAVPMSVVQDVLDLNGFQDLLHSSDAAEWLELAFSERLLVAVFAIEERSNEREYQPLWYALEIESKTDDGYAGRMWAGNSSTIVSIKPAEHGFVLATKEMLNWAGTHPWRGLLPAAEYSFHRSSDQTIDGMSTYDHQSTRTDDHDANLTMSLKIWIALPERRQELLATRVMMSNQDMFEFQGQHHIALLRFFVNHGLPLQSGAVNKRPLPFSTVLSAGLPAEFDLSIPGRLHRDNRVTLRGSVQLPDYATLHWSNEVHKAKTLFLDASQLTESTSSRVSLAHGGSFSNSWRQAGESVPLRFDRGTSTPAPDWFMVLMDGAVLEYE